MDLLTWIGAVTACACVARYLGVVVIDTATELRQALRRWEAAQPPSAPPSTPSAPERNYRTDTSLREQGLEARRLAWRLSGGKGEPPDA